MKSYKEIFRDFCNTTRLKLRSFMVQLEDRKKQEEQALISFTNNLRNRLFK